MSVIVLAPVLFKQETFLGLFLELGLVLVLVLVLELGLLLSGLGLSFRLLCIVADSSLLRPLSAQVLIFRRCCRQCCKKRQHNQEQKDLQNAAAFNFLLSNLSFGVEQILR